MNVSQYFTASLTNPTVPELHAVQGDGGRIVAARLFAGAEPWTVPEGVTVRIAYELPDGTAGSYAELLDGTPACAAAGNLVTAVIAPGLCREAGTVRAVLILRKGEQQISTFPFLLHVVEQPGGTDLAPGVDVLPEFAGKLYLGDTEGNPIPLEIGAGLQIVDGALTVPGIVDERYVQEQLAELKADLEYEPIAITEISMEPSVAQMGAVIENPTVTWTVSREPVEQSVGGVNVDPTVRAYVMERSFSRNTPVTLLAVDERGAVATKTTGISFYNTVYYTDHWTGQVPPTDAQLLEMTSRLQAGRDVVIEAKAGDDEYVLYACPHRMGTPEFWANGFQGGFNWRGVSAHVNACGYREEYDIWVSSAAGLNLTITVK